MNLDALKTAEAKFFSKYPGGFNHPELVAIGKKHKMDKMVAFAQDSFAKEAFDNPELLLENLSKTVTRASMVSVFEKPKFRDFILELSSPDQDRLVSALWELMHGKMETGFNNYCTVLRDAKLAKWSLVTIVLAYFRPKKEVFVKPTTAKGAIEHFKLEGLTYNPSPTWDFYKQYRKAITDMKKEVDASLAPSNAAFSGFLMMSM